MNFYIFALNLTECMDLTNIIKLYITLVIISSVKNFLFAMLWTVTTQNIHCSLVLLEHTVLPCLHDLYLVQYKIMQRLLIRLVGSL